MGAGAHFSRMAWDKMAAGGHFSENATVGAGRGNEGGLREFTREFNLPRTTVQEALDLGKLDPAAKEQADTAGLTVLERAEHIAEWVHLTEKKQSGVSEQNVQKLSTRGRSGEGRPEGGTAKAARDLPIPGPTEERHHQPTIRIEHDEEEDGGEFPVLITGLHRIEALKRLGAKYVDCVVFDGDETEARLWEISENLHRAELTELEWSEHVAEWKRLAEQKEAEGVSGQNVQKLSTRGRSGEGRPEGGINAAVRKLHIDRKVRTGPHLAPEPGIGRTLMLNWPQWGHFPCAARATKEKFQSAQLGPIESKRADRREHYGNFP